MQCNTIYRINNVNQSMNHVNQLDLSNVHSNTTPSVPSPRQDFYPNFNHRIPQQQFSPTYYNLNQSSVSSQPQIQFITKSNQSSNFNVNSYWKPNVSSVTQNSNLIINNNVKSTPNN